MVRTGSSVTLQAALPLEAGHGPLVPIGHQDTLCPSRGLLGFPRGRGSSTTKLLRAESTLCN